CDGVTPPQGRPKASGNFLVSPNFFRTRDTFRQDLIDESQLIRVLSPDPTNPTCAVNSTHPAGCANAIFTATTLQQIDPTQIFWVSQSLGSMSGTIAVSANPRITKAAFSVGGGSTVDIFTNSPS